MSGKLYCFLKAGYFKIMLTVQEINNTDELMQLRPMWNQLLRESECDNIFLTSEWIFSWWKVYGNGLKLFVLVLREGGKNIICIAPFYIRTKKFFKKFWVNELRFLSTGEDISPDYLNVIVKKGRESEAMKCLIEYLRGNKAWDIAVLTDILSTSGSIPELSRSGTACGLRVRMTDCATCPYIKLPSSWEEYLSGLGKNMRYNIKRRTSKLEKDFKVREFIWEDVEKIKDAIDKLGLLHRKRWEKKSLHYGFSSIKANAFHEAAARELAIRGWLHLSCLELDGDIVGMFYDICYGNKMFYFQGGFDPGLDKYSIGLVLRANIVRKAIEKQISEIDLLKGAYEHKYRWTRLDRQTVNIFIGKKSFVSNLLMFDSFNKPQIKSAIRNRLPEQVLELRKAIKNKSLGGRMKAKVTL